MFVCSFSTCYLTKFTFSCTYNAFVYMKTARKTWPHVCFNSNGTYRGEHGSQLPYEEGGGSYLDIMRMILRYK